MRKRFSGDIKEAENEFERRFAVYKHKTEAELHRERQIFREMRVRENQLTQMLDTRDREIQDLNLQNRRLQKKLRKVEIRNKEVESQVNELVLELETQRETYRLLQEQFDHVNTSRLRHTRSDKSLDEILQQPVSHTEFELQKENDFLHMRLQQLSKEITQIKDHRDLR